MTEPLPLPPQADQVAPAEPVRVAERRTVGGNSLELALVAFAVTCVAVTIGATVVVGRADYSDDLRFDGTLREASSLITNRGSAGIATLRATSLNAGFRFDTLAVSGDTLQFPSLARGGFLRDQIDQHNDQAWRLAVRQNFESGKSVALSVGTPSIFRLTRTDSGYQVLSADLNEFSLAVPSPRRDRQWVTMRTADGHTGPSLVGMFGTIDLLQPDSVLTAPAALSGVHCRVQRRGGARLLYCGSAAGAAVGAAFDLGLEVLDTVTFTTAQARMSRSTPFFQNGVRVQAPSLVRNGDMLYTRSTGAMIASNTQTGVLAGPQWLNGKPAFLTTRRGTIQQLSRAGRSASGTNTGVVTLGLDAAFAGDLDRRVDDYMRRNEALLEKISVVVADIGSGEIKALSQSGVRDGEPLRALEPLLYGSMVKPLMAAAILSQDYDLAGMQLPYAGEEVNAVGGMQLRVPFRNPANGCTGTIDLVAFLECSSNQYAAELFVRSIQRSTGRAVLARNGVVPNAMLENTPLTNGLLTLFDDVDVVRSRDPGRSDRIWRFASGAAEFVPRDRSMHTWKSRPWYIDAHNDGTSVDLLSRFAFGGWENRWTQLGAAEAYARIATDRRVNLTMMRQGGNVQQFQQMQPTATRAFRQVRRGLAAVVDRGTASGLGSVFSRVGSPGDSLVVLGKTGTLNEVTARSADDGVYLKSLAIVVGKRSPKDPTAPLRCGVVIVLHAEFNQDWQKRAGMMRDARLPDLHRQFAVQELAAALQSAWPRIAPCGTQSMQS